MRAESSQVFSLCHWQNIRSSNLHLVRGTGINIGQWVFFGFTRVDLNMPFGGAALFACARVASRAAARRGRVGVFVFETVRKMYRCVMPIYTHVCLHACIHV